MKPSISLLIFLLGTVIVACGPRYTEVVKPDFVQVQNENGATLGYHSSSGVTILEESGYAFKDLNRNNKLDPYEDWRLSTDERALDLASKMTVEQIAGLMLYSAHQFIPGDSKSFRGESNYGGKPFSQSGADPSDLSDDQQRFLMDDNLRHVLIVAVQSPEIAAKWNNKAQAYVEGIGLGIPINTSSDPRHGSDSYAEFNAGAGGDISMWPGTLGITASFDPGLMKQFGEVGSQEYRALGIATALSPQIDLATEPRWSRFDGTMGEDPDLAADMARAYVEGFQNTNGNGWGNESVNTMVKHWPGGGPEEGGRDGHFGYGAYAVYPGNRFEDHLTPFVKGAFNLEGSIKMASAVMPYYTISTGQDLKNNEKVANGFNEYLITDLLRGKYKYDGVLCTDWGITRDAQNVHEFRGKPWGVENLNVAQRHYKAIQAGMDQFGGNNDKEPVLEAYKIGVEELGESVMRQRFETSAVRLLRNIFNTGLFENPYRDVDQTRAIVGNPEFMKMGYQAQLKSIIMLKNSENTLPLTEKKKVFVPQRYIAPSTNWFGFVTPERTESPFNLQVLENYVELVDSPKEADIALVGIEDPTGMVGYDIKDREAGGNGYMPISLQYGEYTATTARDTSLAGGSPFEDFTNRSYKGKTVKSSNYHDMNLVNDTKKLMGDKPVIVVVKISNPMIMSEIEESASAILLNLGVQDQALMDIITGKAEPSALLPFQMPADMLTVEEQFEDTPRDMRVYVDGDGNSYDFAFGLNWSGKISDDRVLKYQ